MATDCLLRIAGQTLQLLPERCLLWQETGVLLLADLHLGKAAHLRHHGLPVPEGNTQDDLHRLERVMQRTRAREVIICGDFFHAATAQSEEVLKLVEAWRQRHPEIPVFLVTGNHDKGRAMPHRRCRIESSGADLQRGPFRFVHDPAHARAEPGLTISGHLHPCAILRNGSPALKAPCFWWQAELNCLVLPGFGSFTAGVGIHPEEGDTVHAICNGTVTALPVALLQTKQRSRRIR